MIRSPILLIGCPRSGTTLLYNLLSEVPDLWSIGYESKAIIERYHHPSKKGWESGELYAEDLTPESHFYILSAFEAQAAPGTFWRKVNHLRRWLQGNALWGSLKRQGRGQSAGSGMISSIPQGGLSIVRLGVRARNLFRLPSRTRVIRLMEKTPENCLRLPFLSKIFPDARVIYLIRDGRPNINSLMEGWQQPVLFPGYQVPVRIAIPGDRRGRWAFTLIPGWRELVDKPLEEVCAWQWVRCNQAVLAHCEAYSKKMPYLILKYEDLIARPETVLHQIAEFIEVDYARSFSRLERPLTKINVVSDPEPDKWQRENGDAIRRIYPIIKPVMEQLGYW